MKLGTRIKQIQTNIFGCRTKTEWSRDQHGGCIQNGAWLFPILPLTTDYN